MVHNILLTHVVSVVLFLVIYLIKTFLLLANNTAGLDKFKKITRIPEMVISLLFLATGVYLLTQIPVVNMFMIIKLVAVFASIPLAVVGFKKGKKALAVISVLLIIGAYGLAEVSHKKATEVQPAVNTTTGTAAPADGKSLYMSTCVSCHGEDGKKGAMGASDLSKSGLDAAGAKDVISKGRGGMPAYGGQLTPEQISSVADYIQSLKK